MKRGLIIADRHHKVKEPLHPAYQLVKSFAKEWKPDFVVDIGDTLDLDYFSEFSREKVSVLADCDWEDEVDFLNRELDDWQEYTKEYIWDEGNHDYRARVIGERVPAFKKTLDYVRRFHLKDRGIKFHLITDDSPGKIGKLHHTHGWYWNKYHASKHLDKFSGNIVYGHVHVFQQHSKLLAAQGEEVQAQSIACLCDKQPDFVKGRPTGWQHGFAAVYLGDNGNFNLYPVNIIKNSFLFEGREWR